MSENKTAIQVLTQTIEELATKANQLELANEELATKANQLELANQELKRSTDDWLKYYIDKKELAEKLANELDQVKAELEALKQEKGE